MINFIFYPFNLKAKYFGVFFLLFSKKGLEMNEPSLKVQESDQYTESITT